MRIMIFVIGMLLSMKVWAVPGVDIAQAMRQYAVLLKQLNALKTRSQADRQINRAREESNK